MHELSITQNIIEIVQDQIDIHAISKVISIRLKVGELAMIEPSSLIFCFDILTNGTPMEGARLEIEHVPIRGRCVDCGDFLVGSVFICPECGGRDVEVISGSELAIIDMEVE